MKALLSFTTLLLITFSVASQSLETQIDDYLNSVYDNDKPGASILIAKDGKPIYQKAFGVSNLELEIPMSTKNVFEIGSITKQFTAVAILMLEEQGKLDITDEITKYIPDYPTQETTITIHHLLNHTSGIKSYTSMPSFRALARTDMTPTELIDVFKNEPMDFKPGEQFLYNNSGYILLGHIIEVVTGESYEDFIEKNIFKKANMLSSHYGKMSQIIKHRASGYQQNDDDYVNANYLSLTLPYAAGSLMSTTEDLLKWQNAISANAFIKRNTLDKAINGSKLNSGEDIPYGYGWIKGNINGSTTVEHSGGIFGYTTNGIFLPEENIYVIGLSNCNCGNIGAVTTNIAAMAIGKPFPKREDAITLSDDELKKWVGAYEFEGNIIRHITLKNNQLYSQREGSTNLEIYPMSATNFIFDGGTTVYNFYTENNNRMVKMTANGNTTIGKGIDKALPSEKKEIALSVDVLKQYVGKYELQPGLIATFTIEDNTLFTQLTGQPKFEIFAEREDHFFLKVVPAEIIFNKKNSKIESLTLKQAGQVITAKKIE